MTLMATTEKVSPLTDMFVSPVPTPQGAQPKKKRLLGKLVGKKTNDPLAESNNSNNNGNNRATEKSSLSGSLASLEKAKLDKNVENKNKNLFLNDVKLDPPTFLQTSESPKQRTLSKEQRAGDLPAELDSSVIKATRIKTMHSSPKKKVLDDSPKKKVLDDYKSTKSTLSHISADSEESGRLRRSNSDISLNRFRIASEDSDSIKSIKSSPFQPKPPIIPRKTVTSPLKPKSSLDQDGLDKDDDSFTQNPNLTNSKNKSYKPNKEHSEQELNSGLSELSTPQPFTSDFDKGNFPEQSRNASPAGPPVLQPSTSSVSSDESQNKYNESPKYRNRAYSEQNVVQQSTSTFNSYHGESDISDEYLAHQVGSVLTVRSLPTPSSPRLPQLSSVISLPPFNQNFSSKMQRTAYKSEPSIQGSQINGGSTDISFSQTSFSSSALPAITVREARSRSYLFGNINSGVALLGSEELQRYFPDRKVKIFVGTWNMEGRKDLDSQRIVDFILPESCELVQDIYVIGTQENSMQKKEWEITLQENLGPSYVLFHSTCLGSLHLAVFMRRDLIWFCSNLEENNLTTRAVTMIKTKGSVALAFSFFGTSMLFINSHFTACYQKMSNRVNDYEKTIRELRLTKGRFPSSNNDAVSKYDSVFWSGDFNFRVNGDACPVESMLENQKPNFEKILRSDQLLQLINDDMIFKGFQEGRIIFPPTYKFDVKSDKNTYNKLRTPSYTDRVLFRSRRKNCITCIHYNCADKVMMSDHKPVFGTYEVLIRPGRDTLTLDAGRFNKEVYIEANKRRSLSQGGQQVNQKSSSTCSIQ